MFSLSVAREICLSFAKAVAKQSQLMIEGGNHLFTQGQVGLISFCSHTVFTHVKITLMI